MAITTLYRFANPSIPPQETLPLRGRFLVPKPGPTVNGSIATTDYLKAEFNINLCSNIYKTILSSAWRKVLTVTVARSSTSAFLPL